MEGNIEAKKSGASFSIASVIYILISFVYTIALAVVNQKTNNEFGETKLAKLLPFILGSVSTLLAVTVMYIKGKEKIVLINNKKNFNKYNLLALPFITIGFIFGLGCLNILFADLISSLGFEIKVAVLPDFDIISFLLVMIFVCILTPITEELIFRKFILSGVKGLGLIGASILTSICFSIYHMNPAQTIYQLLVGLVFAIVVLKTNEIMFTIIPHAINNIFIILNEYFFHFTFKVLYNIVFVIIGIICLSIGLYIIITKNEKIKKEEVNLKLFFIYGSMGFIITILLWVVSLVGIS